MKVTLSGDFVNETTVGARARITRENFKEHLRKPVAKLPMDATSSYIVFIDIPAGQSKATFDLTWRRDWSRFPTSDIDLIVYSPSLAPYFDAATLNAPERLEVENPESGTWYVFVESYEVYRKDKAKLYVTLEE